MNTQSVTEHCQPPINASSGFIAGLILWLIYVNCPNSVPSQPFIFPNLLSIEGRVGNRVRLNAV